MTLTKKQKAMLNFMGGCFVANYTVWRQDRFTDYIVTPLYCSPTIVRLQGNKAWLVAVKLDGRWEYLKKRPYIVNRKKTVFEFHKRGYVTTLFLTRFGLKTESALGSMIESEGDML